MEKARNSKGFGLVEAVVAVSIAAFSILAVWKVYTSFLKLSISNPSLFQSSFLAEEGIEAMKFMRDSGWSANIEALSTSVPYALVFDGSAWKATSTLALIDGKYDRRVMLHDVYRDASGNIASSGSFDPGTRKVTVTVSWRKGSATTTKEVITYVSKIFDN